MNETPQGENTAPQVTQVITQEPSSKTATTRNDVKAAADAAIQEDAKNQPEGGNPEGADKKDKGAPEKERENKIAVVMRARKQAQRIKEEAEVRAQARLDDAEKRYQSAVQSQHEFERKVRLAETNPEMIRDIGLNPAKIIE